MRKLGVFLGEEDLVHLWEKVSDPACSVASSGGSSSGGPSAMGTEGRTVSLDRLTASLGINHSQLTATDMAYAAGLDNGRKEARRCVFFKRHNIFMLSALLLSRASRVVMTTS
jgi:hypothetical protein